jgi:hypothetical protein
MVKIVFPWNDQRKQIAFQRTAPLRIPFYANELSYEWGMGVDGITLYLLNGTAQVEKEIIADARELVTYLHSDTLAALKRIEVEFAKLRVDLETLGDLDPYAFLDLNACTLGDFYGAFADWIGMEAGSASVHRGISMEGSQTGLTLRNAGTVCAENRVSLERLDGDLALTGLVSPRSCTLGELDPQAFTDIDMMMSTFRILEAIPAGLVKEISVTYETGLSMVAGVAAISVSTASDAD